MAKNTMITHKVTQANMFVAKSKELFTNVTEPDLVRDVLLQMYDDAFLYGYRNMEDFNCLNEEDRANIYSVKNFFCGFLNKYDWNADEITISEKDAAELSQFFEQWGNGFDLIVVLEEMMMTSVFYKWKGKDATPETWRELEHIHYMYTLLRDLIKGYQIQE